MGTSKVYICVIDEAREEVDEDNEGTFSVYEVPDRHNEGEVKEISVCASCKKIIECICEEVFDNKIKEYAKKKKSR
jgi:hypothetical protein